VFVGNSSLIEFAKVYHQALVAVARLFGALLIYYPYGVVVGDADF